MAPPPARRTPADVRRRQHHPARRPHRAARGQAEADGLGFTSIRSAELALNDVNVLVGANGAGKSNFIRALSMLGRIVDSELGLFVGLSGGANALLNIDPTVPRLIRLEVKSDTGRYRADLTPAAGDAFIFNDETIWPGDSAVVTSLGRGHRETALTLSEPLWVPGSAQLVETLRGCRVFHFQDTSPVAPVKQHGPRPRSWPTVLPLLTSSPGVQATAHWKRSLRKSPRLSLLQLGQRPDEAEQGSSMGI